MLKNLPANAGDAGDKGYVPELRRSLGEGSQPTPVFLPGKFHGQRSLAGHDSSRMHTYIHTHMYTYICIKCICIHVYIYIIYFMGFKPLGVLGVK